MENLFSYGTLRDEKVQRVVFGHTVDGTADAIVGYRLVAVRISNRESAAISGTDKHTILEPDAAGAQIEGIALRVSAEDLRRADAYESAEYKRVQVRLRSGIDAWVYVRA